MDWRSERKNFKWSWGLQIEFTEVESMNDGAPVGLHGVEQGHIPAWGRTVQGPSSPDHWRWLPSHTKFWSCWALFIYLSICLLFRNGHPRGSFIFLSVISQQSNQLCKASDFRADHVPFLPGKGLFACFYESYYIAL